MVAEHGLTIAEVACDSPVVPGGSPLAGMMRMSTRQLRDKYLATGMSSEQDLTLYDELSEDPNSWVLHYSTVRLLARLAPAGNAAPTAAT
jgi:hypothetical protein